MNGSLQRHLCHKPGNNSPRILIFRGGALGDFILTLPAIAGLRRKWPSAFIEVTGKPEIARVAVVAGLADKISCIDSAVMAEYFVARSDLHPAQAEHIRSFDLAVSYLHDPDRVFYKNLVKAGARRVISVCPRVPSGQHASGHYLKALHALGIRTPAPGSFLLKLPAQCRDGGKRRLARLGLRGGVAAIHPGSGSPGKNWPLKYFLQLADRLQSYMGLKPLFILGEVERDVAGKISKQVPGMPVLKDLTLIETASVLSVCRAYVGNDSGVTHLAAALGVPTVAIFGPTDPAVWAPRGQRVKVVSGAQRKIASVSVKRVKSALSKIISARRRCRH